jgi:iron complex transport system substrate-binding protein
MIQNRVIHFLTIILLFSVVIILTSCGSSRQTQPTPTDPAAAVEIIDSFGRTVRFTTPPKRIVSLAPNMTETLFLLGAGNTLVGRTDYCDYPPETANIPSVGSITNPNIEYVLSLKPDLIVGSTHFQKETLDALENLNIPVYLGIIYNDYEEIFSMITTLARIVGKSETAENIVADMRAKKAAIEAEAAKAVNKPRVYYVIDFGDAGDYTAGKGTFISTLIHSAGGINAGDDIEGWRYSVEALFRDEPDIILCGVGSSSTISNVKQRFIVTTPYNRLRAVREGRVYEIDNNILDRIGPRNIDGLEALAIIFNTQ